MIIDGPDSLERSGGEAGEHARVDLVGLAGHGAIALTLRASAISISQPHSASRSRTQAAPLIVSMQP